VFEVNSQNARIVKSANALVARPIQVV